MILQHPRAADAALAVSGGSFLTAHWFLAAQSLAHFGANVVSICTGVGALMFYIPAVATRVKRWWNS